MSIDKYLDRSFDDRHYNCWDFAREVWLDITGEDINHRLLCDPARPVTKEGVAQAVMASSAGFKQLPDPVDPCLVFMQKPNNTPHVGVFMRGRVLSIDTRGVTFLPLGAATLGFTDIGYYV